MAIAYGTSGSATSNSGVDPVLSPGMPATTTGIFYLVVSWKSSSVATPVVTASTGGWDLMATSAQSVVTGSGADTGSTTTVVYTASNNSAVKPGGTTVTFSGTVGLATAVTFALTYGASALFTHSFSVAEDASYGANYTSTNTTNMGGVTNDFFVACVGTNSDAGTPSAQAISATGSTLGATTQQIHSASAVADDLRLQVLTASQTSGTQSGGTSYTHTNASSTQGTTVFIRVRELTAATLTVVPKSNFATTAGYDVDASGLTPYTHFRIYREQSDSGRDPEDVRGAQYQLVTTSAFSGDDYEFHFGYYDLESPTNTIVYNLELYQDGNVVGTITDTVVGLTDWHTSATTEYVTGTVRSMVKSWLSVPTTPSLNIPVVIQDFKSYDVNGSILSNSKVLGKKIPVLATDTFGGREGTFTLMLALDDVASSQGATSSLKEVEDLLTSGEILLLRNLVPYLVGIDDVYFAVSDYSVERANTVVDMASGIDDHLLSSPLFTNKQIISVEVQWVEGDRPLLTDPVSTDTWQALYDNFTSWAEVKATYATWLEMMQASI